MAIHFLLLDSMESLKSIKDSAVSLIYKFANRFGQCHRKDDKRRGLPHILASVRKDGERVNRFGFL